MKRLAALLAPLLAAACASFEPSPSARLDSPQPEVRDCAQWYLELDRRVAKLAGEDAPEATVSQLREVRGPSPAGG